MRKIKLQHCLNSLLLFITFYSFGQVTTTITDLKVNNTTSTEISFNSNSITVKFDVNLLTYDGSSNNILGNIHIFIKQNATSAPIQVGWSPVTFTVDYPPFVTKDTYKNRTSFTVELQKSVFFASGGVLYAEYKNNNGSKFKSASIAISGGTAVTVTPPSTDPTPVNPGGDDPLNPHMLVDKIRYAETNEIVKDYRGDDNREYSLLMLWPKNQSNLKLNAEYIINKTPTVNSFTLCGSRMETNRRNNGTIYETKVLAGWPNSPCTQFTTPVNGVVSIDLNITDHLDGEYLALIFQPKGHNGWEKKIYFKFVEFLSTDIFPILDGRGDDARVTQINGKSAVVIAGEVLDERRGIMRPLYVDCDEFRWFRRHIGENWVYDGTIPPDINNITQPTEFFRRSFYKGSWVDSNIILIDQVPVINPNAPVIQIRNTICCDQIVAVSSTVATLIGNVPSGLNYTYKWQSSVDNITWTERSGANSVLKDFTPSPFYSSRESRLRYYRRAVITPLGVSYSNSVKIEMGVSSGRTANADESSDVVFNEIHVFPNPTSGVLNINGHNLEMRDVKIFDITGRQIDPSGLQKNDNSIEMDISNLPNATYLLSIESSNGTIYKKVIKN